MTRSDKFIEALTAWARFPFCPPSFGRAGSISRAMADRRRRSGR